MQTGKTKDGTNYVQFTEKEIEEVKQEFYSDVDRFLEEKYTVTLPLFALKFLVEKSSREVLGDNDMLANGLAISNAEGVEMEAKDQIAHIVADELTKSGFDGQKFVKDIRDEVLKRWDESLESRG